MASMKLAICLLATAPLLAQNVCPVSKPGAAGIQEAIDSCAAKGGGVASRRRFFCPEGRGIRSARPSRGFRLNPKGWIKSKNLDNSPFPENHKLRSIKRIHKTAELASLLHRILSGGRSAMSGIIRMVGSVNFLTWVNFFYDNEAGIIR